tara:strand:- start:260 stop:439 length:180 start_codon:yes stop_codon:yes gene_type:complete
MAKELSTTEQVAKDRAQNELLEAAFIIDGRDKPEHPQHNLYTGLAKTEAYAQALKILRF